MSLRWITAATGLALFLSGAGCSGIFDAGDSDKLPNPSSPDTPPERPPAVSPVNDEPAATHPSVIPSPRPERDHWSPPLIGDALKGREREHVRGFERRGWATDFSKRTAPITDFLYVGLKRDSLRPIDEPNFASASTPPSHLREHEPVIAFEHDGDARAYPLDILMWHEIVNDVVGGMPVVITFCPLCNSALAFERMIEGETVRFGTTGVLRHSNLVMWDNRTQSWWQQVTGEALLGEYAGKRLELLNANIMGWGGFLRRFPQGKVMLRPQGNGIRYDVPPYAGYEDVRTPPLLDDVALDGRLSPMERVVALQHRDATVAYPFSSLKKQPFVNDRLADRDLLVIFKPGTLSAFIPDYSRDPGRPDVSDSNLPAGSALVFDRSVGGRTLTFRLTDPTTIVDDQTGSEWNFFGEAVDGPMAGRRLSSVSHATHFWFAWSVFHPDTEVRTLSDERGM